MDHSGKDHGKVEKHHHHIVPNSTALTIGIALLVFTAITVWVAGIDLGRLNFVVAFLVASIKGTLVALFFMNLKYDRRENGVIFATSFLFLAIFIVLTGTDLFFRGDVYVKGPLMAASTMSAKSKLKKPWISTPTLVAQGKDLFNVQCVSCHGNAGKGDGPAASALNPPPRNFTVVEGWKNGRKPTMVFKTLKEGIAGSSMASFSTLPSDDRWALVHYVLSLGSSKADVDTAADFAKAEIDPTQEGGGATEAPTIPIELALARMAQPDTGGRVRMVRAQSRVYSDDLSSSGAKIYRARCLECHGTRGEGGVQVSNMGVNPMAFVTTRALAKTEAVQSAGAFNQVVLRGLPGNLMPAAGAMSSSEIQDLYQYVRTLAAAR